jgi:hypothetical protein
MQTVFSLIGALLLLLSAPAFAKTSEADESSYYCLLVGADFRAAPQRIGRVLVLVAGTENCSY